MKTKIKRHSRAVLSIVLTLCMLVSCMTVGIIATDAANVTGKDDTALGASVENDDTVGAADDGESVGAADDGESVGANISTVYFFNTGNWASSNVKIHHWGGTATGTSWSGNVMTQDSTFTKLYSYSPSSGYFTSCKFNNNGSNSTGDLSPSNDGYIYSYETGKWFSHTLKTIYIKNSNSWSDVYLDLRDDSNNRYVKKWGGVKVLKNTSTVDGEGYYTVTSVGDDTYKVEGYFGDVTKIILHNGSGTQTSNTVSFTENNVYDTNGDISSYEQTYSVSVKAGTGGTVASASVNAGATAAVKLPTAKPKPGYDFNNWTATSPATISSGENIADGGYVTADDAGGSVTANFTPKANMYLSGWINGSAINVVDENYKFTKISDTNYTKSFTATGACYVTLNDGTTVYHPSSNNSPSGSEVDPSKTTGYNENPKWYIDVSNGDTVTVTWNPSTQKLSWTTDDPGQGETVKVYAKDGTIRRKNNNYYNHDRNNIDYSTFEKHANTFVYDDSGYAHHIGARSSNDGQSGEGSTGFNGYTYDYIASFEKGQTLYIKTVLANDTYMNRYYLYAYSINGKCYQIHTVAESDTGSVTEAFTVPEDWEYGYVEITPIYFLRDSTNEITFYVEGYDEEVMNAGWGNTPYVYPFYQDANNNNVTNVNNPFGGYQGQPLVFYKGNYYTQLPKIFDAIPESGGTGTSCTIRGVTLGNGYWDDIHYLTKEVTSHFQTYDYDDLYKIVTEYPTEADHVICSFKYRTKKNNDEPGNPNFSNYNKTNGNGWEVLTDYYGRPVDVFGNVLTEGSAEYNLAMNIINGSVSADSAAVVHAISQDYKSNSAGSYGTEWAIYNTDGKKVKKGNKTTIVPSALAIQAGTGSDVTSGFEKYDTATKAFKDIYKELYNDTKVLGKPAVVTYEQSIYGGSEKADRCDARWYFSTNRHPISATTRIEYTDDGRTWNTDTYTSGTGTGSHTGTKAYFTGKASTATDTPDTPVTPDGDTNTTSISGTTGGGYYTFKAENNNGTNGNYEFVGWYLLRDNYQNISTRSSYHASATTFASHAEQSKNGDIFVARFKKTATGTLDIFHKVHPQASGYGTVTVSAIVKDSNGDPISGASYPASGTTDHVTIPSTYIKSGEGYKVVATFKAEAYPTSNFDDFYATIGELLETYNGYNFIVDKQINKANGTATITYDVDKLFSVASGSPVQTVTSITHYSKFSLKTNLTYSLEYKFKTRYYDYKLYKYDNVAFTEQELKSYFLDQITDPNCDHIKLDKQFVVAKAPFESNFREDLTWGVDDVTFNNNDDPTIGYLTAYQVDKKTVDGVVYDSEISGGKYEEVTKRMTTGYMKLFSINANATDETAETFDPSDNDLYRPYRTTYLDGGVEKPVYIHHWNMYQLDTFSYDGFDQIGNLNVSNKAKLVAQSYSSKMNYVGFEDYAIVPVYSTEDVNRQEISDNRTDASATLLSITRNHWNTTTSGEADDYGHYDDPNTNYDRLYVDFMLNYNYSKTVDGKAQNILLNSTGENIKVGFVVKSYTVVNGEKVYREGKSQTVLIDKSKIDDKNRLEYCYGFNNTQNNSQWGLNFEFTPFIVDTNVQTTQSAAKINIDGTDYQTLYPANQFTCLDGVTFYMIGKADTDWA